MKKLLNILDEAPDIVLQTLDSMAKGPGNNEKNEITQHFIGGHPVSLTKERLDNALLQRQISFVRAYIAAKGSLLKEMHTVGVKPASVLPADVFYSITKKCGLVCFEELGNNGEQFFDFHQLHLPFAYPLFWLSLATNLRFRNKSKNGPVITNWDEVWDENFRGAGSYLPPGKFHKISFDKSEDDMVIFFPENGDIDPSDKGFGYHLSMPTVICTLDQGNIKEKIDKVDFEKLRDVNNLWRFCLPWGFKNVSKAYEAWPSKTGAQVKVTFPEIPVDLQQMLLHVHEMLPHWDLYTAAAPGAFTIKNERGYSMLEYIQQGVIPIWQEVYKRVHEKHAFLKSTNMIGDYLKAHNDDPIFYYIVKNTFNGVEYSHAVVFGQYGDFPDEKKALEISKVYSKAYEGNFQN